jgi:hypothetical protein
MNRTGSRTAPSTVWAVSGLLLASTAGAPLGAQSPAECGLDPGPGATLFLPYFEVDLANPQGLTTLFSIGNVDDQAVLTKVTLWTDVGVPTAGLFVYLTGYDVQTVNLRDLFEGRIPRTADAAQDPTDTISPRGELSDDTAIPNCAGHLPMSDLPAGTVAGLRAAHQGLSSFLFGGSCVARPGGDQRARGFVTVDAVNNCTLRSPQDPGYFVAGGLGDAIDRNVLWGDFFYVDPTGNFAQGESLVRLESLPGQFGAGSSTFYGWLHGNSGKDSREPLPSQWVTRFVNGGPFDGGTDLILWQSPNSVPAPFPCGQTPAVSNDNIVAISDEQENFGDTHCGLADPPPPHCGQMFWDRVVGRAAVGEGLGDGLAVPFDFGAIYVGQSPTTLPVIPPLPLRQRWLGSLMSAEGRFGVGFSGTPLGNGCRGATTCLPGICANPLPPSAQERTP